MLNLNYYVAHSRRPRGWVGTNYLRIATLEWTINSQIMPACDVTEVIM